MRTTNHHLLCILSSHKDKHEKRHLSSHACLNLSFQITKCHKAIYFLYLCRHLWSPLPGEGNGNPLQYSCLENPMDGGAWWAAVHGVVKSRTRLSDFTFTFYFHTLEKETATHSSVLAWRIPGTGQPGGLLSMGSHRVRHDWSDLAAAAAHEKLSINTIKIKVV